MAWKSAAQIFTDLSLCPGYTVIAAHCSGQILFQSIVQLADLHHMKIEDERRDRYWQQVAQCQKVVISFKSCQVRDIFDFPYSESLSEIDYLDQPVMAIPLNLTIPLATFSCMTSIHDRWFE